jgi:hypothetical protein
MDSRAGWPPHAEEILHPEVRKQKGVAIGQASKGDGRGFSARLLEVDRFRDSFQLVCSRPLQPVQQFQREHGFSEQFDYSQDNPGDDRRGFFVF